MKYMNAKEAAELDEYLMSPETGFSLDQLMELAGLSVASALQRLIQPPASILIICGPGNNGGDGLVAARHLYMFGYTVTVLYPKRKSGPGEIYTRLVKQLTALGIDVLDTVRSYKYDYIIDAIFGFSFSGDVRAPYDHIIKDMQCSPILSVDVPSSWSVDSTQSSDFHPTALISLSVPKPCSANFTGRHFLGGRFLPKRYQEEYQVPQYQGADQVTEFIH